MAPPSSASRPQRGGYKGGRGGGVSAHRALLNQTYRFPLPTLLPATEEPTASAQTSSTTAAALTSHTDSGFAPDVVGVWDEMTGSVWVTDPAGMLALWTRGNFGKGSLSRSEPTYLKRRIAELTNESNSTS
jgi:tRNA-splicing endonuclease subunit Sen2